MDADHNGDELRELWAMLYPHEDQLGTFVAADFPMHCTDPKSFKKYIEFISDNGTMCTRFRDIIYEMDLREIPKHVHDEEEYWPHERAVMAWRLKLGR